MKCPKCKSKTEVLETSQTSAGTRRRRACLAPACLYRFTTSEVVPGTATADIDDEALLPEWLDAASKSGKYDREALAACVRIDRRKRRIAREQKERERRERSASYDDGWDRAPDTLDDETLRKELKGY